MSHGPQKTLWVAAIDGSKGLIYRNEGDAEYPVLKPVEIDKQDVPQSRDIMTDRPGRKFDGQGGQRSALDEGDAHDEQEKRFAEDIAGFLNKAALNHEFDEILIYAASRSLGFLRPKYHEALQKRIRGEFNLDVVNEPVDALEKRVSAALSSS
ncbi:baeRF12 domain-containing protein [Hyphobacterium indicum]|uniref:baeRF12 domain-containing protein n=1 Tax=Hyphobacterium indicum TaxID=2162714 RepID=UPI000D65A5F7|nr:host attachment family protein [Hyphobacterium indicum]